MAAICLLTTAVYWPGLQGPFILDDFNNISLNPQVAISDLDPRTLAQAMWSNESGPLKRPLAALSFALNHYIAGDFADTFPYKVTNLVIHLLNMLLVYWLSRLLISRLRAEGPVNGRWRLWVPMLTAATWGLHPLNLTSVLYVVQRMTSLSALFVFAGLIVFMHGRLRVQENQRHGYVLMSCGLLGGLLLGLASKENAVLLTLLALVIELVFFNAATKEGIATNRRLGWYYALVVVLPWALVLLWVVLNPQAVLAAYAGRDFTLTERLLTEARVLCFYTSLLLFPRIGAFGIFHDDISLSTGLLTPWSTLPALLGLILTAALALGMRRRLPLLSFAVLWFLAGHALESGIIGLEIAHEHRNYVPGVAVMFSLSYYLARAPVKLERSNIGIALIACYIAALGFTTHSRAYTWSSNDNIAQTAVANHPLSPRAHYMLAEVRLGTGDFIAALEHYRHTAALDRADAHALIKLVLVASAIAPPKEPGDGKTRPGDRGLPSFLSQVQVGEELRVLAAPVVNAEIERRLSEEVVRPHTAVSLAMLSLCVLENRCRHLHSQAVKWYGLALKNPRIDDRTRAHLAGDLARLYLGHGAKDNTVEADQAHRFTRRTANRSANR